MIESSVDTAVILAAGMGTRLASEVDDRPKGLLRLGERPIIEESILRLLKAGIERIVIVTGFGREFYERLRETFPGRITTVHNDVYHDSGSMYSLYCAGEEVDGDFLLLESDLIYEQRALKEVTQCPGDNCVLLSGWTGAGDEVFVATQDGKLVGMSKDREALPGPPAGELVGITRVSASLFRHMLDFAEDAFDRTLHVDYETDCLVGVATRYPINCHVSPRLLWGEIDDPEHLARARDVVYPAIRAVDGEPA